MHNEKMKPVLLTFSEKNRDVYNLINNRDFREFKQHTDYICNAIRFYESYKNKIEKNNVSIEDDILEKKVLKILEKYSVKNSKYENNGDENKKEILKNIEEDIDGVDIEED